MASPAWTKIVSPTAALTRATLTRSMAAPVSTSARPSSSSRTTRTSTATSPHVRQLSSGGTTPRCPSLAGRWHTSPSYRPATDGPEGPKVPSSQVMPLRSRRYAGVKHARLFEEDVHQLPEDVVCGYLYFLDHA